MNSVAVWNRWEHVLKSTKPYGNPYQQVVLKVSYEGPGGYSYRGFGFWDGEQVFKIRTMFSRPGVWKWHTSCSDTENTGLHDRKGEVMVLPYMGKNQLYRRGYLSVSENRRYLQHDDCTPFLWIGDTAWLAGVRASLPEWRFYVRNRLKKGFSVILIGSGVIGSQTDIRDRDGYSVFTRRAEAWNPPFWRGYESKIQFANESGMVVCVTGLMKRIAQLSEDTEDAIRFGRSVAARLAGNFVIFSPDQNWGDAGSVELADIVGEAVKEAAPFHLVTQHPKRRLDYAQYYYDKAYLDFCSMQTGQNGPVPEWRDWSPADLGVVSRFTIESLLALSNHDKHKPIINLEGAYDYGGNMTLMVKRGAYLSFLCGAKGFTTGTQGVWQWGMVTDFWETTPPTLRQALKRPYSDHMRYLHDFLRRIPWWQLEPHHELIKNQEEDWSRRMAFAITTEGNLAVGYLPDNETIVIDMSALSEDLYATWFHPGVNTYRRIKNRIPSGVCYTFRKPKGWMEAVLILKNQTTKRKR